ncbi:MAG: class I SAM-dependent methyltransferase [Burkholderiales bacterium]
MDQLKRVQNEFTRQADTFDAYAPKADVRVEERFREALGEKAGAVLDLACGPGVVTAAVARLATSVVAFDATPAMLDKARKRCAEAGLENVVFRQGDAAALPFERGEFDTVVTRLAIHHFEAPSRVLGEIFRILRPGGRLVIADVVASEDAGEAALQNAIENLRDPSHVRMLPLSELSSLVTSAGFEIVARTTWDKDREFEEWMGIANDAQRAQSLRIVARMLAADGHTAGMGLSLVDDRLVFFHRWTFLVAVRLPGGI